MSDGKMPADVKRMLRKRRAEARRHRRETDPSPVDFDDGDLAAAVDWVVQEVGGGAEGGGHTVFRPDGMPNGDVFVYLRYARRVDAWLAGHLYHATILKAAGPGERLVNVYHPKPVLEAVRFLCGGRTPPGWRVGVKYLGVLNAEELMSWVGYTRSQAAKVRELLRKAGRSDGRLGGGDHEAASSIKSLHHLGGDG